ncbi:MAG: DUF1540 domain-containing protein [Desulfitobacteriaceae bacterium]
MDNNLKCDASNCVHNMEHICSARQIQVQGGDTMGGRFTYCGTFAERNLQNYMGQMSNVNIGGGLKQLVSDQEMDPIVACTANNCVYNGEQYCQADHVNIVNETASISVQTECQTFYPR